MSVIAAKVYPDRIVMAADSIVVRGWQKSTKNFQKIACINDMIVSSTGNASEVGAMWHFMGTHRPLGATEKDILDFIVEFSKWKNERGFGADVENGYLLAYRGHLFQILGLFVSEIHDFAADGAGIEYATAALHLGHTPQEAVKVACDLSCFVAEPVIEYTQFKEGEHGKSQ